MMSGYEFSLASVDDAAEIIGIYHSLIGTQGCTWNLEYPDKEIVDADIKEESLYILKENDEIIAVAALGPFNELEHLLWKPKNPCELARIGVVLKKQGQGVGTMILQRVIEAAKARGFDGIRMLVSKTNPAALALYTKNGFERCGEVFMYEIDFYCYQMTFTEE